MGGRSPGLLNIISNFFLGFVHLTYQDTLLLTVPKYTMLSTTHKKVVN